MAQADGRLAGASGRGCPAAAGRACSRRRSRCRSSPLAGVAGYYYGRLSLVVEARLAGERVRVIPRVYGRPLDACASG